MYIGHSSTQNERTEIYYVELISVHVHDNSLSVGDRKNFIN